MAPLGFVCPVPGCRYVAPGPGVCPAHLIALVPEQPETPAPAAAPEQALPGLAPAGTPPSVALDFPWGQLVEIPADGLKIGRESPVFAGSRIHEYDQISRRHARLWWRDGDLLIDDCDSLNHTYVDGERIVPGRPVPLVPGQRLRLGLDVHVTVVELNEFGEPRRPASR